jgi:tRNA A37 threonylcarbamoyladenosine dehydratase
LTQDRFGRAKFLKMGLQKDIFQRTELLFGEEIMERLASKKVILFGIGGVGSWCAESLIRSGIHHLTIVDSDRISVTNINRQIHATTKTVGEVKTEVLKSRLLEINPGAEITALQKIYSPENSDFFELDKYDFIIDAIDSLSNKVHLIRTATRTNAEFFSSMGASLKLDPAKIKIAEFWKVQGCPLASKIRGLIRKGELPAKKFMCIYSEELLKNRGGKVAETVEDISNKTITNSPGNPELANHDWTTKKAVVNGTIAHITAIYGFMLAGLVVQTVYEEDL